MLNCKCLSTSRTGLYILNNAWHDVRAQCINISTSQATIDWICARLNYDSVNLIYNIKLLNVIYRKIPLDLLPTSPKYLYSDKIIPTVPKSHCFEKWRWIHFLWWRWCGSRRILQHLSRSFSAPPFLFLSILDWKILTKRAFLCTDQAKGRRCLVIWLDEPLVSKEDSQWAAD